MSETIVLEGSDYTGKTTLSGTLDELGLPISDRSKEFISSHIQLGDTEAAISAAADSIERNHPDDLVVLLVARNGQLLAARRDVAGVRDAYDLHAEKYNDIYAGLADRLVSRGAPNVVRVDIDGLSLFDTTRQVVEPWVTRNQDQFDLDHPTVEGHSKRIAAAGSLAVAELKPSLFSITHNRYDTNVEGTDSLRLDFWESFGGHLNREMSRQAVAGGANVYMQALIDAGVINPRLPFVSNFLGRARVGGKDVTITRFTDELPPIEIIWKDFLVGTMKHKLREVARHPMRDGRVLDYEDQLPHDIVRFDWRNPVPDSQIAGQAARPIEDEAIPEDFANFYINVDHAKLLARAVAHGTNELLKLAGYQLVDTCYFMNSDGTMVFSEITPDGMRIKSLTSDGSFDKDLWRQGKDAETLQRTWGNLLSDLVTVTKR